MFSVDEREALRATLLTEAADIDRITGAAITGSASLGNEDEFSDIDMALGISSDSPPRPTRLLKT